MNDDYLIQKNFIIIQLKSIMDFYEINLDEAFNHLMGKYLNNYMFESLNILLDIQYEIRKLQENIVSMIFISMYKYEL